MGVVQGLLVAAVLLGAGSAFLAIVSLFGAGIEGVVFALRGLALALACLLGAGVGTAVSRASPGGRLRSGTGRG